jgi:hypothetical protein
MTKHDYAQAIILALTAAVGSLVLWAAVTSVAQCNSSGGTTVRGLFWLERIK